MSLRDAALADLASRGSQAQRLSREKVIEALLMSTFGPQGEFVRDKSRSISVLVPRRGGKTVGMVVKMLITCLNPQIPKANVIYVCPTQGQAKKNIWAMLRQFDADYELCCRFHETILTMTFPWGAQISLVGAGTRLETEKQRGQAFDLVVLDESKSYPFALFEEFIQEVIRPALADRLGQLVIGGTPGSILRGPFYQATNPETSGVRPWTTRHAHRGVTLWSYHRWALEQNSAMPHLWDAACELKRDNAWPDDHPVWKREYLGEWSASDVRRVYAFDAKRNVWAPDHADGAPFGLPRGHEWRFLLGADFGFEDDFALEVGAFSPTHPTFFQVWDFKSPHLTIDGMAKAIKQAHDIFSEFDAMVADPGGLGNGLIASLAEMYGYRFDKAEKTEKLDYIELLNADLISGRVQLHPDSYLVQEMLTLHWKDREADRPKEDKSTPNHCCDAWLYLWRYALHHFYETREVSPEVGSQEYWENWQREEKERAVLRRRRRDSLSTVEADIGEGAEMFPDLLEEFPWQWN